MAGQIAIVGNYFDNLWNRQGGVTLIQGIYFLDCGNGTCNTGGPVLIDNNELTGLAMNIYIESENPVSPNVPHDFTVTRNALIWPYPAAYNLASAVGGSGCRNQIEFKGGVRINVSGNYISGAYACQDNGNAILLLGFSTMTDVTVSSNVISKSGSGLAISGLGNGNFASSHASSGNRIAIKNNLLYDLGRGKYNADGPGYGTGPFVIGTPLDNLSITNNTIVGPIDSAGGAYGPMILYYTAGVNGPTAGISVQNNILPYGVSSLPGAGIAAAFNAMFAGAFSHPPSPLSINTGTWSFTNYTTTLGSFAGYAANTAGLGMQGVTVVNGGRGYPASGNLNFTGCTSSPRRKALFIRRCD